MSSAARIGKYEIGAPLGSGGFATAYRAVDTTLGRPVALKLLHPQLLLDPAFVQRFYEEARTVAALRHPNIITIYEVNEDEGRLFIAMDLAARSLAARLAAEGPLPWREALALLKGACAALDHAHGSGVVHRDLKPANILLGADGTPILSDFGFARIIGDSGAGSSASGGTIVGTPGYIAPEVWEHNQATPATDIYALGCIVYEALSGLQLFAGASPLQVMRAHDRGPQLTPGWWGAAPAGVDAVVRKALARDPAQRPASAGALWRDLAALDAAPDGERQVANDGRGEAQQPRPEPQPEPRPPGLLTTGGRPGCTLVVTLALLLALGGLGGFVVFGGGLRMGGQAASGTGFVADRPSSTPEAPTPEPPTEAPTVAPTAAPSATPTLAPTPPWVAEPAENGRVLDAGAGGRFAAISRDKELSPAYAGEPPSCLQGLVLAESGRPLRHFAVEVAKGAEVRRADHDHLTGTYAICGLEPGDWSVWVAEYLGYPTDTAERLANAVRFHTSGQPGEVFYISYQARGPLPEPATPLFPPIVPSPRPAEVYNGRWEGILTGSSPAGPVSGRLAFTVADDRVVFTASSGAPCAWDDPDIRVSLEDGFSFAGLAADTRVYYRLSGVFDTPESAAGRLRAEDGRGAVCIQDAEWTARKVN